MGAKKYNYKGLMALPVKYDPKRVEDNADTNVRYMIARTRRMMKWDNLPDTIPERNLEVMLQTNGHVCIAKGDDGNLYAFIGSFSGVPDTYYLPTQYVVANPYLNLSKTYTIGVDCVIIRNDSMYMGLLPLFSKYCSLIANAELTMDMITILARAALVFDSEDENEWRSAEDFVKKLYDGELGIITRERIIENGVRVQPGASPAASVITNLIEAIQYWKASQFNEVGLNANWNAKRETLTSSETLLNSDTLLPFCEDMLRCRQEALDDIERIFGIRMEVDFDSSWLYNMNEIELIEEQMENEANPEENKEETVEDGGTDDVGTENTEDTE